MRILYKALASVGMIALSTAAAFGVRHLAMASKKRRQEKTQENVNQSENVEKTELDDADVFMADVEIKKDSCCTDAAESEDGVDSESC